MPLQNQELTFSRVQGRRTRGRRFWSVNRKLSCANKQERCIIPCCLSRELLECLLSTALPGAAGGLGWYSMVGWLQSVPPFPWARGGICSFPGCGVATAEAAQGVQPLVPTGIFSSCSWVNNTAQTPSIPASLPPALSLPQISVLGTEA